MQTFPLHIMLGSAGSGPELKNVCGQGSLESKGFDSILQGLLGSQLEAPTLAQAYAACTENMHINQEAAIEALNALLEKLNDAARESGQILNGPQLTQLIEQTLTDEEKVLLNDIFSGTEGLTDLEGIGAEITGQQTAAHSLQATLSALKECLQSLTNLLEKADLDFENIPGEAPMSENAQEQTGIQGEDSGALMLAALQDKLQSLYALFLQKSLQPSVQQPHSFDTAARADSAADHLKTVMQEQGVLQAGGLSDNAAPAEIGRGLLGVLETSMQHKQQLLQPDQAETAQAGDHSESLADMLREISHEGNQKHFAQGDTYQNLFSQMADTTPYAQYLKAGGTFSFERLMHALQQAATQQQPEKPEAADAMLKHKLFEQAVLSSSRPAGSGTNLLQAQLNQQAGSFEETLQPLTLQVHGRGETVLTAREPAVNPGTIIEQLTDKMSMGLRHGETKLTLQIYPPDLGRLHIDLSMKNNSLRAVIIAETHQAKQLIETNIEQLRACLEGHNIDVEKVTVFVGQEQKQFASYLKDQRGKGKRAQQVAAADTQREDIQGSQEVTSARMLGMQAAGAGGYTLDLFA